MKLSELKFEDVRDWYMNYDEKDCMRTIQTPESLEDIRERLMSKFGDVEVEINPDAIWSQKIRITSENWAAAHKAFVAEKAAWCDRYGCD